MLFETYPNTGHDFAGEQSIETGNHGKQLPRLSTQETFTEPSFQLLAQTLVSSLFSFMQRTGIFRVGRSSSSAAPDDSASTTPTKRHPHSTHGNQRRASPITTYRFLNTNDSSTPSSTAPTQSSKTQMKHEPAFYYWVFLIIVCMIAPAIQHILHWITPTWLLRMLGIDRLRFSSLRWISIWYWVSQIWNWFSHYLSDWLSRWGMGVGCSVLICLIGAYGLIWSGRGFLLLQLGGWIWRFMNGTIRFVLITIRMFSWLSKWRSERDRDSLEAQPAQAIYHTDINTTTAKNCINSVIQSSHLQPRTHSRSRSRLREREMVISKIIMEAIELGKEAIMNHGYTEDSESGSEDESWDGSDGGSSTEGEDNYYGKRTELSLRRSRSIDREDEEDDQQEKERKMKEEFKRAYEQRRKQVRAADAIVNKVEDQFLKIGLSNEAIDWIERAREQRKASYEADEELEISLAQLLGLDVAAEG